MTFVILTGGIDLSVGSVVALSTLLCAEFVGHGWPPLLAFAVVLLIGAVSRALAWAAIIHYFEIQPFIVTLAGMFLARGLCYAITVDAISITHPGYVSISAVLAAAARRALPDDGRDRRDRRRRRRACTSSTSRGSAAPSTPSAETRSRRS